MNDSFRVPSEQAPKRLPTPKRRTLEELWHGTVFRVNQADSRHFSTFPHYDPDPALATAQVTGVRDCGIRLGMAGLVRCQWFGPRESDPLLGQFERGVCKGGNLGVGPN